MRTLPHLAWQPVILLKVVRAPFRTLGGLSLNRAYLTSDGEQLLYADWTLEANERCMALVCHTGWAIPTLDHVPFRLQGQGSCLIPSGTWVLPYTDNLFSLYSTANTSLVRILNRIDRQPTDSRTLSTLIQLIKIR